METEKTKEDSEAIDSERVGVDDRRLVRPCVTHHFACDCREERFRRALADAIRRPMGTVPDSAEEFLRPGDLEAAEERRPKCPLTEAARHEREHNDFF